MLQIVWRAKAREDVRKIIDYLADRNPAAALRHDLRLLNGLPAIVIEESQPRPRWAPRWTLQVEIGDDDQIRAIHAVLATRKLHAVRPVGPT